MSELVAEVTCDDRSVKQIIDSYPEHIQRKVVEIVGRVQDMGRDSRKRYFELGRLFCGLRDAVDEMGDGKVTSLVDAIGVGRSTFYRYIKVFEIFEAYPDAVPHLQFSVMSYFATKQPPDDLLAKVVAMARSGEEVSMRHVTAMLPVAQPTTQSEETVSQCETVDDESAEDATEPRKKASKIPEEEDVEEWLEQEEEIFAEDLEEEEVPAEEMRQALVRRATESVSAAIRDIDDFCRAHRLRRGKWYQQLDEGSELALEALRTWLQLPL